jgi:hypothetical protein
MPVAMREATDALAVDDRADGRERRCPVEGTVTAPQKLSNARRKSWAD